MPGDFTLQEPQGLGNDYQGLLTGVLDGDMPADPVTVVVRERSGPTLAQTMLALKHQTYPKALLNVVVARATSGDLSRNNTINQADSEWIVLLDSGVVPVAELIELFVRHLQRTNSVLCGNLKPHHDSWSKFSDVSLRELHARAASSQQVDPYPMTDAFGHEPHPFQYVDDANIAFSKALFQAVGPFDETLAPRVASVEWAYRAWNRGSYIIPVPNAVGFRRTGDAHNQDDETLETLLLQRCPPLLRENRSTAFEVPQVSIYMPVYNAVETVGPAIRSALAQTMTDLEVCVVDDGSTDGTSEVLRAEFGEHPQVRIEFQPNEGIGAASNRAVAMCRAPFIGQLDADDKLKPAAVERLLKPLLSDTTIGVVYSSSELIDDTGSRVGDSFEVPHFNRYELMYLMIVHHFRLFRARDWHRTDGFATDIDNAVDYDMYLKMSEVTRIVHIPEQLYQYRKHATSTSQARHLVQRANHRLAIQRAMDRQGLSAEWELTPSDTHDPRDYEFQRTDTRHHFGRGLDRVRLSIDGKNKQEEVVHKLEQLFPTWKLEFCERNEEPRVESPWLSHARGVRAFGLLADEFPREAIRLVYA